MIYAFRREKITYIHFRLKKDARREVTVKDTRKKEKRKERNKDILRRLVKMQGRSQSLHSYKTESKSSAD